MELAKTKQREMIFQILYAYEMRKEGEGEYSLTASFEEFLHLIMEMLKMSKTNVTLGEARAKKVWRKIEEIDTKIEKVSQDYKMERISFVDHTILRLMLYEFFYEELPIEIAIHEGVRLSKKFSTPNAGSFVHAIIDAVNKEACSDKALL